MREFVVEFDGLSGSTKPKKVLERAGLAGAMLQDLVEGREVKVESAGRLLRAMQESTRPVQPSWLGVLGEEHLKASLVRHFGADPANVKYKKKDGLEAGVPFVLEVAFGIKTAGHQEEKRDLLVGLNWSPALAQALPQLDELLAEMRVDRWDPVVVAVHWPTRVWSRPIEARAATGCMASAWRRCPSAFG